MHCRPVLLFALLFALQFALFSKVDAMHGGKTAEEKAKASAGPSSIQIAQGSVINLFKCLINYDYAQKARPVAKMPRDDFKTNDEVLDAHKGGKQMEYYMSAYFVVEQFVKHCIQGDKPLETLVTGVLSGPVPDGFIEGGKKRLETEFKEIKTPGWTYENRGSPSGDFGTRSNIYLKALRFWRRMLTPYWLAVKGSILESAKVLGKELREHGGNQGHLAALEWELKRIEDEIEADLLITKYTYHNYYVGETNKFSPRAHNLDRDKNGKEIKVFTESIEDHEKKNLYFDRAYKAHRQHIEELMKKVKIIPDHLMGHPHLQHAAAAPPANSLLAIPPVRRVFWIVRRLSAWKEKKDLSDDQISMIKADLTNAFEHIPVKKIFITLVEHKDRKEEKLLPDTSEENKKKNKKIAENNVKVQKYNEEGPKKAVTKNKEAEITARHILGAAAGRVPITKIPPMPEKKQYVQGLPFAQGDDSDLPTLRDLMQIVTGTYPIEHFVKVKKEEKKEEKPVPMDTEEVEGADKSAAAAQGEDAAEAMDTEEAEQGEASSSQGAAGSLLTADEIEGIAKHQKSAVPAWKPEDWLAPGEEHLEHIVFVTDLAAILALQQLVDSKYKYASPGCIIKLVDGPHTKDVTAGEHDGLEQGLDGLRLISGGIYKHLGGEKHKDAVFFTTYFTN